LLAYL